MVPNLTPVNIVYIYRGPHDANAARRRGRIEAHSVPRGVTRGWHPPRLWRGNAERCGGNLAACPSPESSCTMPTIMSNQIVPRPAAFRRAPEFGGV